MAALQISSADNAAFGTDDAEGGGNPLYAAGAAAGVAGATYGKAAGGRDMSASENPFYGQTDEAGNPLYGGGEDSPTALAGVKTGRNVSAERPDPGSVCACVCPVCLLVPAQQQAGMSANRWAASCKPCSVVEKPPCLSVNRLFSPMPSLVSPLAPWLADQCRQPHVRRSG